jgi:dihydroxy-acid dehydratase
MKKATIPLSTERVETRSLEWFNNPHNPGMTALYLERYLNYGLTREELQSGKPIIGIAQTGNDLSPCNRHHLDLAQGARRHPRGRRIAMEFRCTRSREIGVCLTAALTQPCLSRAGGNRSVIPSMAWLTTGCDKTTPACLMAAATVNMPAISSRAARC